MLDLTPILKLYVSYRRRALERTDYVAAQQRQLFELLQAARDTRFGRDYDFASIRDVHEFQRRVPLRRYEDFHRDYWSASFPHLRDCTWPGEIPFFALSSGTTTGASKYVPCSPQFLRLNRRTGMDVIVHHLSDRPRSRLLAGKNFLLVGATSLAELAPGIRAGDLSGIGSAIMPWWARSRIFPPPELAQIVDWEEKIAAISRCFTNEKITSISGLPSWLLIFMEGILEVEGRAARRLGDVLPSLELICHGGISFTPYRAKFAELAAGSEITTREIYPSSEAFVAVADRGPGEGLRLVLDQGTFFEFVPAAEIGAANPPRFWLGNVERDVNYALVISTCAGLWSYVNGDTVRFVDLSPPRILNTGRTAHSMSLVGEHLITDEVDQAISHAAAHMGLDVVDYSLTGGFQAGDGARARHQFLVEFATGRPQPEAVERFADLLDERLQVCNRDYSEHRMRGFGLHRPVVTPVARGAFARWMKERGSLGGQNKVPRMINDPCMWRELTESVEAQL